MPPDLNIYTISHPTLTCSVESMLCRTTCHSHQHSQNIYTNTFCVASNGAERLVASCMKLCCGKCLSISLSNVLIGFVYHGMFWIHQKKKRPFVPRINKSAGLPRLDPKHPMAIHMFSCTTYQFSRFESYLSVQHTGI